MAGQQTDWGLQLNQILQLWALSSYKREAVGFTCRPPSFQMDIATLRWVRSRWTQHDPMIFHLRLIHWLCILFKSNPSIACENRNQWAPLTATTTGTSIRTVWGCYQFQGGRCPTRPLSWSPSSHLWDVLCTQSSKFISSPQWSSGRGSTLKMAGCGFDPWPGHTKTVKWYLLALSIQGRSCGVKSPKPNCSLRGWWSNAKDKFSSFGMQTLTLITE